MTDDILAFLEQQKAKILADANDSVAVIASDLAQLEALAAKYGFRLIPPAGEERAPMQTLSAVTESLQTLEDEVKTLTRTAPPLFPPRRAVAPVSAPEHRYPVEVAS